MPAETAGRHRRHVARARSRRRPGYSNYGTGQADVAAPGGNGTTGDCATTILSTIPGNAYELHPGHVDGRARTLPVSPR